MLKQITQVHHESRATYGSPRVHAEMYASGVRTSRKRVARIMRAQGIKAKKRRHFRVTTLSKHDYPVAANILNRQFQVPAPNRAWVTDITYFATVEGWLYLATVIDLYSRKVIGWSMSNRIDTDLVLNAIRMAVANRKPDEGALIVHSDRGSQYACRAYAGFLRLHGITTSMSRKGDCWDNAVAESFFATIKTEIKPLHLWKTRDEARTEIFQYIEGWYNPRRRHSANRYRSPVDFEEAQNVS